MRFLRALDVLDRDEAVRQVRELHDGGAAIDLLVEQLLAPAQVEVGRRWEAGLRSVSWEHAATAITDVVLLTLTGGTSAARARGRVVVACAEQEWHSMPARMLTELLRRRQWDAVLIGSSVPADALVEHLSRQQPVALLVSCTMTAHLPGARRSVEAGHRTGIPVMVGGRALDGERRGEHLGADATCRGAREADEVLGRWLQQPVPPAAPPAPDPQHAELLAVGPDLVEAALTDLGAGEGRGWLEQDLTSVVAVVAAALLVRDPAVAEDGVAWLLRYRASRSGDEAAERVRQAMVLLARQAAAAGLDRTHQLLTAHR